MDFFVYPINRSTDIKEIRYGRLSPNVVVQFQLSAILIHNIA
jgi:hypothetical protein